jgi:hypothetical protein
MKINPLIRKAALREFYVPVEYTVCDLMSCCKALKSRGEK